MKILITIVVIVLVLGATGALVASRFKGGDNKMGEVVRLDKVVLGNLTEVVSAPGSVQAKRKVSISARVSARIIQLPFKVGDRVTAGDPSANPPIPPSVLVKLDSKDLEAQLRAAEARRAGQVAQLKVSESRISSQESQVVARRAELANAGAELDRAKNLFESNDVSRSDVEAAQARFDRAEAEFASSQQQLQMERDNLLVQTHSVEAAEAEIARARDSLSYTTIMSPIDGVVTKLNSEVGELVVIGTMNNAGTVILEVADLDTMIVNARVDEATVAQVKMGQTAKVRSQAYRDVVFDGVVTAVALALSSDIGDNSNLKYYKTEITLNPAEVSPLSGLTADVDIETKKHTDVLKVPSQAVLGRPVDELPTTVRDLPEVDKTRTLVTVVYRFVDGKAIVTPVKIGPSDITHTIIETGLKENDVIIAGPYKVLEGLKNEQVVRDETATTQPSTKPAEKK